MEVTKPFPSTPGPRGRVFSLWNQFSALCVRKPPSWLCMLLRALDRSSAQDDPSRICLRSPWSAHYSCLLCKPRAISIWHYHLVLQTMEPVAYRPRCPLHSPVVSAHRSPSILGRLGIRCGCEKVANYQSRLPKTIETLGMSSFAWCGSGYQI
jgi:hypothetical protein